LQRSAINSATDNYSAHFKNIPADQIAAPDNQPGRKNSNGSYPAGLQSPSSSGHRMIEFCYRVLRHSFACLGVFFRSTDAGPYHFRSGDISVELADASRHSPLYGIRRCNTPDHDNIFGINK